MNPKVEVCEDHETWVFHCPGCKMGHSFFTGKGGWQFNGDPVNPTFSPSLLVKGTVPITDEEHAMLMRGEKIEPVPFVCHSFVRNGMIEFLNDCTHELAGQTVPIPDIE